MASHENLQLPQALAEAVDQAEKLKHFENTNKKVEFALSDWLDQNQQIDFTSLDLMAHELLSPLIFSRNSLNRIQRKLTDLTRNQRQEIDLAISSIDIALTIIDSIMIAPVGGRTRSRNRYRLEMVDIAKSFQAWVDMLLPSIYNYGLNSNFISIIEALKVKIYIDPRAIQAIFVNLCQNAIKYNDSEKPLEERYLNVSTKYGMLEDCPNLLINFSKLENTANLSERYIFFVFEDNGVGFDHGEVSRVFEPGFRGKSAMRNSAHGLGFGLSVVKAIVEDFSGFVWVDHVAHPTIVSVAVPAMLEDEALALEMVDNG